GGRVERQQLGASTVAASNRTGQHQLLVMDAFGHTADLTEPLAPDLLPGRLVDTDERGTGLQHEDTVHAERSGGELRAIGEALPPHLLERRERRLNGCRRVTARLRRRLIVATCRQQRRR